MLYLVIKKYKEVKRCNDHINKLYIDLHELITSTDSNINNKENVDYNQDVKSDLMNGFYKMKDTDSYMRLSQLRNNSSVNSGGNLIPNNLTEEEIKILNQFSNKE